MSDGSLTIIKSDGSAYAVAPADDLESPDDMEPGWRVASLSDLEWALERMGEAQATIAANNSLAEEAIGRIRARLAAINGPLERNSQWWESRARLYAETARGELLGKGKRKSRDLPSGSVSWRKSGGGLVVVDNDAALAWAKAQDDMDLVRVKVELSKTALKDRFKASGEVPPGCEVEPEGETLTIKPVVPQVVLCGVEVKKLEP